MMLVMLVTELLPAFIPCVYLKQLLWFTAKPSLRLSSVYWWMSSTEMSQLIIHKSQHNSENKFLFLIALLQWYDIKSFQMLVIATIKISDVGLALGSNCLNLTCCRELASHSSNLWCRTAAQRGGSVEAKWDECLHIAISSVSCRKNHSPELTRDLPTLVLLALN